MLLFKKLKGCKLPGIFQVLAELIQLGGNEVESINLPIVLK